MSFKSALACTVPFLVFLSDKSLRASKEKDKNTFILLWISRLPWAICVWAIVLMLCKYIDVYMFYACLSFTHVQTMSLFYGAFVFLVWDCLCLHWWGLLHHQFSVRQKRIHGKAPPSLSFLFCFSSHSAGFSHIYYDRICRRKLSYKAECECFNNLLSTKTS